jgi:hypothetical protein
MGHGQDQLDLKRQKETTMLRIAILSATLSTALLLSATAQSTDKLGVLAQVSHAQASDSKELRKTIGEALKTKGVRVSDARLTALANDCAAKARALPADKLGSQRTVVCADSQLQFEIQVATSDLRNAESVRGKGQGSGPKKTAPK